MTTRGQGLTTHLTLVATGTRADLLPLLALAFGLKEIGGFSISVLSHACHAALCTRFGLGFSPLKGDPHSVLRSAAAQEAINKEAQLSIGSLQNDEHRKVLADNAAAVFRACEDADAILTAIGCVTEAASVAQKLQIPVIVLAGWPSNPSGEIPLATFFKHPLSFSWLNKLTYSLSGLFLWQSLGKIHNAFRTETLKIGPQKGFQIEGFPQVTCFSEAVVPRPSDWSNVVLSTGFWQLPQSVATAGLESVMPQLHRLLLSPEAALRSPRERPLFVGFESIVVPDPVSLLRTLHLLSRRIGIPIIFACGSTDLEAARTSALLEGCDGIRWEVAPATSFSALSTMAAASRASMAERAGSFLSSFPHSSSSSSSSSGGGAFTDEYGDLLFEPAVTDLVHAARVGSSGSSSSVSSSMMSAGGASGSGSGSGGGGGFFEEEITALTVIVVKEMPLELLSRCSLAVHAASSLSFNAAANAGIPSVCFPAVGEQFFWATRASSLGIALPYRPFKTLIPKIEEAIEEARNHHSLMVAASSLAESLRGSAASRLGGAVAAATLPASSSSPSPSPSLDLGFASVLLAVGAIRDVLSKPQHRHCGITCRWVPDRECDRCSICSSAFTATHRRHHCRSCGGCVCANAACHSLCHLPGFADPQRTCVRCLDGRRAFLATHFGKPAVPELTLISMNAGSAVGAGSSAAAPLEPSMSSSASAAAPSSFSTPIKATSATTAKAAASSSSSTFSPAPIVNSSSSSSIVSRGGARAIPTSAPSVPVPVPSSAAAAGSIASSFQRASLMPSGGVEKVDRSGLGAALAAAGGPASLSRSFHQGGAGILASGGGIGGAVGGGRGSNKQQRTPAPTTPAAAEATSSSASKRRGEQEGEGGSLGEGIV